MAKAKEFYIDWLGYKIEFEHQFEENTPYYIGLKRDNVEIHLSEHYGDATQGSKVFIICDEIRKYFDELQGRPYKYYRPCLEKTFYGAPEFSVQDAFGNKLSFNEYLKEE